jgi:mono/diheme cytochrome c family protein
MRKTKLSKLGLSFAAFLFVPTFAFTQTAPQAQPAPAEQKAAPAQTAPPPHTMVEMESRIGNLTGHSPAGAQLYYRYCWGCHGARGNGDGENTPYVTPMPRNFVAAVFKCRSTVTGYLPTDEDLYNSIDRGFITTNMPSWATLTSQNRADLVAFIKTFSPRWQTEKLGDPIKVPDEPALTMASIQHGKQLYQKLECWKCHGPEGRGEGPSASTLTDSNDQPIKPYNFYTGYRFKCGTTNRDLYKIFLTGLDGTPMPSFADVMKPEEAWDLVHYLRTLQIWHKSPELTMWESTKEGAEFVKSEKVENTYTGNPIHP